VVPNSKTRIKNQIKALNDQILDIKVNSYVLDNGQDPAASSFSLITNPNLFKGMLKSEEIKGLFGNKKQVKFTTAEAVLSSFLHNFVLGHCDKSLLEDNSPLGGGVVGLLPSVNSDKTTVGVAKFDLNAEVREGSNVTYMDLKNPELIKQIQTEIGTFYTKMYDNVKRDFELVSTWIAKDKDIAA
jgi:hypothetical protein